MSAQHTGSGRDHSRNFLLNLAEGACLQLGLTLMSWQTVLIWLLNDLHASEVLMGLLSGLGVSLWTVPQGFVGLWGRDRSRYGSVVMWSRLASGLVWIAFAAYLACSRASWAALTVTLTMVALSAFVLISGGMVPLWVEFINRLLRPTYRGRFYGLRTALGAMIGLGASVLIGWMLPKFGMPYGYVGCFAIAGAGLAGGALFIGLSREPAARAEVRPQHFPGVFRSFVALWCGSVRLRWLTLIVILTAFGGGTMASSLAYPSYVKHALDSFFHDPARARAYAGYVAGAIAVGRVVGGLVAAWAVDRWSSKAGFFCSLAAACLAPAAALAAPGAQSYLATFVLLGIAGGAMNTSYHNLIVSLAPTADRGIHVGVLNTLRSPFFLIAPVLGGGLAAVLSHQVIFWISCGVSLATAVLFLLLFGLERSAMEGPAAGSR